MTKELREKVMQVRLSDSENGLLQSAADKQGLPLATWVRMVAMDKAKESAQ